MNKRLLGRASFALGFALAAGFALALLQPRRVEADLETTFPPGTPNEWYREFAERVPRLRGLWAPAPSPSPSPSASPEATGGNAGGTGSEKPGTATREKKKEEPKKEPLLKTESRVQPELGSGSTNQPFYFAGVLTTDLPIHCGWVKRQGELGPRAYPPAVTDDLYWMAQVSFLRRLLHPSMVGEAETYWHLIQLGDCAREVAKGAKGEREGVGARGLRVGELAGPGVLAELDLEPLDRGAVLGLDLSVHVARAVARRLLEEGDLVLDRLGILAELERVAEHLRGVALELGVLESLGVGVGPVAELLGLRLDRRGAVLRA